MRRRPPQPVQMTLNLAPLVDVMMCLIIFFLLASRLVHAQHRPLDLAVAAEAEELPADDRAGQIVVNVRPGADPTQAEYVLFGWDGTRLREQVLSPDSLATLLRERAAAAEQRGDAPRCLIRADRRVRYGHVETVLRACGRAGIAAVTFSARPLAGTTGPGAAAPASNGGGG